MAVGCLAYRSAHVPYSWIRNVLRSHMCGSGERIQSTPAVLQCACSIVYTFLSMFSFFFELFALMEPFFFLPQIPCTLFMPGKTF